ncbi:MAG: carboxypeptidase regulatory-like domain-containing protein, partial [Blastocatellia bacterium]|nr:carboxypeptidase regulatory-like domain-containing protein [Blastocatellia bacterium]
MRRICVGILIVLGACLLRAENIHAQTAATIVGDVTDSAGAVAPNVTVTVINEGTKTERKVQTNEAGQYRVTPLNPGTYTIQVEATGFKREVRSSVVLEVAAVLKVDFSLQVGEVSETVGITGVTPVLQAEDASVGDVVDSRELQHLPVNQRNYTHLILLMPGTSSITRSQSQGTSQSGTSLYSVNGGRPQ